MDSFSQDFLVLIGASLGNLVGSTVKLPKKLDWENIYDVADAQGGACYI